MDLDYRNLSKDQVIKKYQRNLDVLRRAANTEYNISDEDFDHYVSDHINRMAMPRKSLHHRLQHIRTLLERHKRVLYYTVLFLTLLAIFLFKREVSTIFLRNIQVYIYPVMKLWRRITAPMILFFPSLTELYDESCLVTNPYFQVEGLNCSPCSNVINILDLSNFQNFNDEINENVPYMFRTDQRQFTVRQFMNIFNNNRDVFEQDAFKVKSTNENIRNIRDLGAELLNRTNRPESHSIWRSNRMGPARVLRQYLPHPKRFPQTGTSLERFLMFDTPEAPYRVRVPDTECANVILMQLRGNRKIVLTPTQECKAECRTLSIRLPTSYVLKYNWWYHRAISLPDDVSVSDSVTYVGSYC